MPTDSVHHQRLLAIVMSLPGACEDRPWGSVHCKVAGKIFVGWGLDEDGRTSVGFKTDKELQALLVASDPRFTVAQYVGRHGWVDMKLDAEPSWPELEHFILDSYRMIAPKKLVKELAAQLGAPAPAPAVAKRAPAKPAPAKRAASAKPKAAAAPKKRAR
jgi:predicted DNA-binding protein (MmcQ/YjbR family)